MFPRFKCLCYSGAFPCARLEPSIMPLGFVYSPHGASQGSDGEFFIGKTKRFFTSTGVRHQRLLTKESVTTILKRKTKRFFTSTGNRHQCTLTKESVTRILLQESLKIILCKNPLKESVKGILYKESFTRILQHNLFKRTLQNIPSKESCNRIRQKHPIREPSNQSSKRFGLKESRRRILQKNPS